MQKFGTKVSEFIVVLKPSPFGPDPHFRHLRIEPQFDNVTAYFRSGHIELGFLRTPPVQIGDTITLHSRLSLHAGLSEKSDRACNRRFPAGTPIAAASSNTL